MLTNDRDGRQLCLFENETTATQLDARLWCSSFARQESSLQTIAPFRSRLRPALAQALVDLYSRPGDVVLDPFAGSGVVPFEAATGDRIAWASDLSPYAYTLTRGKLEAPRSERQALQQMVHSLGDLETKAQAIDLTTVPALVQTFFHPGTLREILAACEQFQQQQQYFLLACLLGILHHVLPGYLSYPTNQHTPYLRCVSYAPDRFPHLYTYRDLRSRLLAKIRRVYRHHRLPNRWSQRQVQVWQRNAMQLAIASASVDAIISSPPCVGAFDDVRDNRLRLWFLGCDQWQALDARMISNPKLLQMQMPLCLQEMERVLKPGGYCVLVVGDRERAGTRRGTAEQLADLAIAQSGDRFVVETIYDEYVSKSAKIPTKSSPRSRKLERILVMKKR